MGTGVLLADRYRVISELGRGGFGAVYRAWDTRLNRAVAVKENLLEGADSQRQFMREAQYLADLSHPNLPRVIDYFTISGQGQYLVMDFVDGDDLHSLIEHQQPVGFQQAVGWIIQVCEALEYLHCHEPPLLHRDIKPANIRITSKGRAMLVDFGLVKAYNPSFKTTMGARAVSPGYAPPEQYGLGSTDERSDIYALGATLYFLLTFTHPPESVQRLAGKLGPTVERTNPQIPSYILQAVERAMALDPAQRFQSAAEFKTVLLLPPAPPISVAPSVVQVVRQPAAAELYPATRAAPAPVRREIPPAAVAPGSTQVVSSAGDAPGSTMVLPPGPVEPRRSSKPLPAASRNTGWRMVAGGGLGLGLVVLCLAALVGGYFFWMLAASTPGDVPSTSASLATTPASLATAALSQEGAVRLDNWTSRNFKLIYYDCYAASKCWKYAPEQPGPGEWISVLPVFIDPGWKKPGLVFWHEYILGTQATVYVLAEEVDQPAGGGVAMPVVEMISAGASSGWEEKRVDLSKYVGKRIIIHFQAEGKPPDTWAVSDVMIVPNLEP